MTRIAWARAGTSSSSSFSERHAVGQVVAERVHVVQPVAHHLGLDDTSCFHVLLDAGVQETDIGNAIDDDLAVQLQQQPQHAVRGGMLRSHVQQHGLTGERTLRDQVPVWTDGDFFELIFRHDYSFTRPAGLMRLPKS